MYQCSFPLPAWQSLHDTALCWGQTTLDVKGLWSRDGPRALCIRDSAPCLLLEALLQHRTSFPISWGRDEEESQLVGTAVVPESFFSAGRFEPNFGA